MSLRDRSPGVVRKKPLTLPYRGEEITVRGLMFGRSRAVGRAPDEIRATLMFAYSAEDPVTGNLFFDPEKSEDLQWIDENISTDDIVACAEVCEELSGVKKPGKADSAPVSTATETTNSPTSLSPEESEDEALPN